MTSRDAVDLLSRPLRKVKVGHAGTLDPLATGVLVVCVGAATRLIEHVQRMPKGYRAVIRLGARSDTLDADGRVEPHPDADLAMVLARPVGAAAGIKGVGLFLLPRRLPDGTANRYRIVRLKDKLGTRSMASGEIGLDGALAWPVGDLGAGFRQMADMVNNSRLSNGVRAAGLMRRAVGEALFVAENRVAFGKRLIEMPLMQRQLAKMRLRAEQARTMMFQAADALRRADAGEAGAYALLRILTPLLKFRACRDARVVTGDAMEVRGGCGYIEEWPDARVLRDAHLGSIWEGTSNVVALDVLRAAKREGALDALRARLHAMSEEASPVGTALPLFERAAGLAAAAQLEGSLARQAASALYHVTSAATMAWEATRLRDERRLHLSQAVLAHRVLARDPLAASAETSLVDAILGGA